MSGAPRRAGSGLGWLGVLLCIAAFLALAWQGFGLTLLARIMAGAMVVILALLQLALLHLRWGGAAHGIITLVVSAGSMAGSYQLLSRQQLFSSEPPQTVLPSPTPLSPTATTAPPPKGHPRPESRDRFAQLANPERFQCASSIRTAPPVTELAEGFDEDNWRPRLLKLLATRYPDGHHIVTRLSQPNHFDVWFQRGRGDWAAAMLELPTGVHEASHIVDIAARRGREHVAILSSTTELRFPIVKTFPRSEIRSELPSSIAELSYTRTYLTGDSGNQGIEMVLEEENAYTYSVLTAVAVADQLPGNTSVSIRDGLMVFIYYVEAYLKLARTQKPDTYRAITGNKALTQAVVRLHDRAACALSLTAGHDNLGIADGELWPHVFGEQALGEVERLRKGN